MTRLFGAVMSLFLVLIMAGLMKGWSNFLRHSSIFCLTREDPTLNYFFDNKHIKRLEKIAKSHWEETMGSSHKFPSNSWFFILVATMYWWTLSSDVEISLKDVIKNSSVRESELTISWMNDVWSSSVQALLSTEIFRAICVWNSNAWDYELPFSTIQRYQTTKNQTKTLIS